LAGRIELPRFATDFRDRSTLVVVRGVDHQRDLRALRPFIRDLRPVIVAVDGGADALLEAGLTPDMIVGDMDSAGERALRCGAELLVRNLEGMSSTFLTRLRIGEILVDAKGVSRLYRPRPGLTPLLVVIAAG